MFRFATVLAVIAGVFLLAANSAEAVPYGAPGPFKDAEPKWGLPQPFEVPSKEYSDNSDKGGHDRDVAVDPSHGADAEQIIAWDGLGGTSDAHDTLGKVIDFDDSFSRLNDTESRQVDAIANKQDALFNDVKSDSSYLLFSVSNPPGKTGGDHIFYETPMPGAFPAGLGGPKPTAHGDIWAAPSNIEGDGGVLEDLDGLEVWSPPTFAPLPELFNVGFFLGFDHPDGNDTNRYSLEGDPLVTGTAGEPVRVSIWNASGTEYLFHSDMVAAIESLSVSGAPSEDEKALFDLDALMVLEQDPNGIFDIGDQILFSIAPVPDDIAGLEFDGGEIFQYTFGDPAATFLFHGDHLWDTAFDVSGHVAGFLGVNPNDVSENINALEAVSFELDEPPPGAGVPEPSAILLVALSLLSLGMLRRRR